MMDRNLSLDPSAERPRASADGRIELNEENLRYLEAFGALYWSTGDMADFFGITDFQWWESQVNNPLSSVARAIKKGELEKRATIELGILQGAMKGNADDVETYRTMMRDKSFALSKLELFGGPSDPGTWQKVQDYISSGSKGDLSDKERRYLDLLNLIFSLDGQFGKRNVIKFLTSKTFGYSYQQAVNLYSEAVEMFYCNRKVSRDALREKTAELYDSLYLAALKAAKSTADYAEAAAILDKKVKLLRLGEEDIKKLDNSTYERRPVVLSLNPEHIGLEKADRRKLAEMIDNLPVPESEKNRLEAEAGIVDLDIVKLMENESQEAGTRG